VPPWEKFFDSVVDLDVDNENDTPLAEEA